MPQTMVIFFAEPDGTAPLLSWMDGLPSKVQDKCYVKIERLGEMGYELRIAYRSIQYRVLYFFHENIAVISHGLKKESEVPGKDIEMALKRMEMFKLNPQLHTYEEEIL
jgi:phage-related protein